MGSTSQQSDVVVWEWQERPGLWIPYQVDVCRFLEERFMKLRQGASKESTVDLGKCSPSLNCYEVDLVNMEQQRIETRTLRKVKRSVYPSISVPGKGVRWEWYNDVAWIAYDIPTSEVIERAYKSQKTVVDLSVTPVSIPNFVDFRGHQMIQVNKHTHYQRKVQRSKNQNYPNATLTSKTAGTSLSNRVTTSTTVQGCLVSNHTTSSKVTVSRKGTNTASTGKKTKKVKVERPQAVGATATDPLAEFCNDLETVPDEDCAICFEKLCNISSFDDGSEESGEAQSSSIKELNQCKHVFHASCLQAMYDSGAKDGSLQCPTCKAIHGIKHGNQPKDGRMDVQHSHSSLPGHSDCGMITIVYDFHHGGIQGPEHPNPGKRYSARGFPRTCFLPDNHKGRKVLKLLKKAWQRRLVFTIGTSSTTGEDDTVVWNEIHHKTEAFSNHGGHGFPDPSYLDNVLAELAAQGVRDDSERTDLENP